MHRFPASPPSSCVHGIFQDMNTGVHCHFVFQEVFLTQRLNPHLLHQQAYSLPLHHLGSQLSLIEDSIVACELQQMIVNSFYIIQLNHMLFENYIMRFLCVYGFILAFSARVGRTEQEGMQDPHIAAEGGCSLS